MSSILRSQARARGTWRRRRDAAAQQDSTRPTPLSVGTVDHRIRRLLTRAQPGANLPAKGAQPQRNIRLPRKADP